MKKNKRRGRKSEKDVERPHYGYANSTSFNHVSSSRKTGNLDHLLQRIGDLDLVYVIYDLFQCSFVGLSGSLHTAVTFHLQFDSALAREVIELE